jgi:hypothetical protein
VRSNVPNVLRNHQLQVRGQGVLPIGDYITPIYRARQRASQHVVYGGARWVQSYGNGFKLRFIDRLSGEPAYLYVAPGLLGNRKRWIKELAYLSEGGYCTVYVLGDLQHRPERHAFSIDVASPEHLVIATPRESMSRFESRESAVIGEASASVSAIASDAPSPQVQT